MNEKPILFSGPMVRAILSGAKTQTRRVFKGTTEHKGPYNPAYMETHKASAGWASICPYGQPGDRLWVKETYQFTDSTINETPGYVYRATDPDWGTMEGFKWKPSIFCTRKASRITLEITKVRVERLQDIGEADAQAEGCQWRPHPTKCTEATNRAVFRDLWKSINGPDSWAANPWVWVIDFRRVKP